MDEVELIEIKGGWLARRPRPFLAGYGTSQEAAKRDLERGLLIYWTALELRTNRDYPTGE